MRPGRERETGPFPIRCGKCLTCPGSRHRQGVCPSNAAGLRTGDAPDKLLAETRAIDQVGAGEKARRSRYRLRKQTAEPVIGNLNDRGLRQFLLRGPDKVAVEWSISCTAHHLLRLAAERA